MMRLMQGRMFDPTVLTAIVFVAGFALGSPVAADCFADYKAKQDRPLRLHYGVAQVQDDNCSRRAAGAELAPRLARDGWTLLNVLGTFGPDGLNERKASAGEYFLRF